MNTNEPIRSPLLRPRINTVLRTSRLRHLSRALRTVATIFTRSIRYHVLAVCIAGITCPGASAEEMVRTWTRKADGVTCRATLADKRMNPKSGVDEIKLLVKSGKKTDWMELSLFSEEDEKHVAEANLAGEVFLKSRTVFAQGEDGQEGADRRIVEVTVQNTDNRSFKLKLVWLGKSGSTNGIHEIETATIKEDGIYRYQAVYKNKASHEVHRVYRGYAVGLTDGVTWLAQDSAQPPHLRFIGRPDGE